jgi:hypothetical protein
MKRLGPFFCPSNPITQGSAGDHGLTFVRRALLDPRDDYEQSIALLPVHCKFVELIPALKSGDDATQTSLMSDVGL